MPGTHYAFLDSVMSVRQASLLSVDQARLVIRSDYLRSDQLFVI